MYSLLALAFFLSHTICSCHLWDRIEVHNHFICVECGDLDTTLLILPCCKSIFASKLLFRRLWRFGIELSRVLWIDFSEKSRLQRIVTVVKRENVENRNWRQQKLWKTWAPESVTKKNKETREQNISTGVEENVCHDLCGSSLRRINKKCFVTPARNFLP